MMICKKCGTANDDSASVCKNCGKPLASSGIGGKSDMFDFSICSGLMVAFSVIALILILVPATRSLGMTGKAYLPSTTDHETVSAMLKTVREKQTLSIEKNKIENNESKIAALDAKISNFEKMAEEAGDSDEDDAMWKSSVYATMQGYYEDVQKKVLKNAVYMTNWEASDALRILENQMTKSDKLNEMIEANDSILEKEQELEALRKYLKEDGAEDEAGKARETALTSELESLRSKLAADVDAFIADPEGKAVSTQLETIKRVQDLNAVATEKEAKVKAKEEENKEKETALTTAVDGIAEAKKNGDQAKIDELTLEKEKLEQELEQPRAELAQLKDDYNTSKKELDTEISNMIAGFDENALNRGALNGIMEEHKSMHDTVNMLMMIFIILLAVSFFVTIVSWITKMYRVRIISVIANTVLAFFGFMVPLLAWTFESKWPYDISSNITYGISFSTGFVLVLVMALATLFTGLAFFADELFGKKN